MSAMAAGGDWRNKYIEFLEQLHVAQDRGALAALRRGLGKPPGTVPDMFPLVVPFIPENASAWEEGNYYVIGSLYPLNPERGGRGNMGEVFRSLYEKTQSDSVERRFVALLKCHGDDLPEHLRHAVSLASSKEIPIDWNQLFIDVKYWNSESGFVQKRWAESYWGKSKEQ